MQSLGAVLKGGPPPVAKVVCHRVMVQWLRVKAPSVSGSTTIECPEINVVRHVNPSFSATSALEQLSRGIRALVDAAELESKIWPDMSELPIPCKTSLRATGM